MKKRLIAAVLMIGAVSATMVLGASAYWNTPTVGTTTTAQAGTPALDVEASDCVSPYAVVPDGASQTTPHLVPGGTFVQCLKVTNTGDGTLNVYSKNTAFSGNGTLLGQLTFQVADNGGTVVCNAGGPAAPNNAAYATGNGWKIATLAPGQIVQCKSTLAWPDLLIDQSPLEGLSTTISNQIWGSSD